jgi:hypothetical protein
VRECCVKGGIAIGRGGGFRWGHGGKRQRGIEAEMELGRA